MTLAFKQASAAAHFMWVAAFVFSSCGRSDFAAHRLVWRLVIHFQGSPSVAAAVKSNAMR
jgi:hypothetical protein